MRNQKTVFWINLIVSIVLIAAGAFIAVSPTMRAMLCRIIAPTN